MSNSWLDEDDVKPQRGNWEDDDVEDFDPNRDYFTQKVERKESNMLNSTERSLRILEESERVGAATLVEMDRQGEVLRRTETKVDKMEQDLKQSDRHLRSIKSLWGAFVNKFSKEPPPQEPKPAEVPYTNNVRKEVDPQFGCSSSTSGNSLGASNSMQQATDGGGSMSASSTMSTVDDNLDLMGNSLSRLKNMGLSLQNEIDAQDEVLGRLGEKVKRVDNKVYDTNKKMLKIYHS